MADSVPLLHIIAQKAWHDSAFIVGNLEALKLLRQALDAAMSDAGTGFADVFAEDGEGYALHVRCLTDEEMATVPYGYTDPDTFGEPRPWPLWMWPLWMKQPR